MVLLDTGLPTTSGMEEIRRLSERYPGGLLVMFTVYNDDQRAFEALRSGACVYLLKNAPPAHHLESLREVMNARSETSQEVLRSVIKVLREIRQPGQANYKLTPHEKRLLTLLTEGHTFKTAAVKIGVCVTTVAWHVRRIYEKLQVHSKSEAVAKALRDGII